MSRILKVKDWLVYKEILNKLEVYISLFPLATEEKKENVRIEINRRIHIEGISLQHVLKRIEIYIKKREGHIRAKLNGF